MGEIFYLFGCMLLLLDLLIPGHTREKLVVSYFRYKGGQSSIPQINEVCKLCKNTGFSSQDKSKRPKNYPEDYFLRFKIPIQLVDKIITSIKDDDIFRNLNAYPQPDHRSVALANQGQFLYVLLYFTPETLINDSGKEIIDKHFNDNWVIPFYMGYTIDLSEYWANFKSANIALNNTLNQQNIQSLSTKYKKYMKNFIEQLGLYLQDGQLSEDYVLENINELLICLRESNVTVRWMLLQRTTLHKKSYNIINEKLDQREILHLLLLISKFEDKLNNYVSKLLNEKQQIWDSDKKQSSGMMQELAEYFSGDKPLTRVQPDENYQNWFLEMKNKVKCSLDR